MSKKFKPFLAHSEFTDCIYIIDENDKYEVTEQCIKAMEATNRMPRWIPVREKLPEKPDNYPYCEIHRTYFLVSLASGCVKTLGYEFDRDEWQITGSSVVAWMPLPLPWKGDDMGYTETMN